MSTKAELEEMFADKMDDAESQRCENRDLKAANDTAHRTIKKLRDDLEATRGRLRDVELEAAELNGYINRVEVNDAMDDMAIHGRRKIPSFDQSRNEYTGSETDEPTPTQRFSTTVRYHHQPSPTLNPLGRHRV